MAFFSLSDRYFYPLALLAAGGIIWLGMQIRPAGEAPVITEDRYVMEGPALAQLIPGPGTASVFDPTAPGGPAARVTANASLEAAGRLSAGVGALVPEAFEAAVLGREIEVRIDLQPVDPEHDHVHIGYFVVGRGDSGWRQQPLSGTQLQTVTMRHRIPLEAPVGNNDWVGLWPDSAGTGRTVIVRRIEVRILPENGADGGFH